MCATCSWNHWPCLKHDKGNEVVPLGRIRNVNDAQRLAQTLPGNVCCVDLNSCGLNDDRLHELGGGQGFNSVLRLRLGRNSITYLCALPASLQILDLSSNTLSEEGVKWLGAMMMIRLSELQELLLNHNHLSTIIPLCASFKCTARLTHLYLDNNRLTDDSIAALAECLLETNICHLSLAWNLIGDVGILALDSKLEQSTVQELYLGGNQFSIRNLRSITKLTILNLSFSNLADGQEGGMEEFTGLLPNCWHLLVLNLESNLMLGDETAQYLQHALFGHLSLHLMCVDGTGISLQARDKLEKITSCAKSLKSRVLVLMLVGLHESTSLLAGFPVELLRMFCKFL